MEKIEVTVNNDTGIHSRPADFFVRTCKLYKSNITLFYGEKSANAKNILQVILLNICKGETICITADGEDEKEALIDLKQLVESDFKKVNALVII
ncbi:hypothetical protein LSH36_793g00128 [Paralvinella palmiformis]|uniref:HPr domain-containing protein n=1 Tax=Paralvinella palmiformis TaxID=53620 RepID=A0AAD9MSC6_9ANNE|nr:hypothetical protein LSH36_793g00128 [Paralvinella palmiformis]